MLDKKKKYSESKCKFGFMMPKLLISFINKKKKDTLEPLYLYNETKSYLLKSADPRLA